jgi:hypothetical protein
MNNYTFSVEGLRAGCASCKRIAARAAFDIADVVAVGIDDAGTVTLTSDRHIGVREFSAATKSVGFRTICVRETELEGAS